MFSVYDLLTRSIDEIYPPRKKFNASDQPVSQEDRVEFLARLTASGHSRGFVWLLRSPSQPDIYIICLLWRASSGLQNSALPLTR